MCERLCENWPRSDAIVFTMRNNVTSARTRYFELWQQFVQDCHVRCRLSIHLCLTSDERADILTKAMAKDERLFAPFRDELMNA